ncbi:MULTISPECIES: flavodoxin [Atopobiaceae]|uniref:Flavodoxin n=1 Tax=Parafannyhessea umbonata TaxID=604330 RepID=A0A1H6JS41_9ACTN|nr:MULTISPECIES: flavodoxin [Atopobiaceae]SEH63752.1 Flavodoxin [Parafannyhessea umbonata]SJZ83424.1 Flavodoxin [Olsenella sp. KH1P3]
MTEKLVAYFSASGTTAKVAKDLAAATGADLFEIEPENPYSSADLNWQDKKSRTTIEMNDESCRPAIAGEVADMGSYDTVFVGFPVWWYVEPRIIDTFLEAYDFTGKTVVPFATSGGSGLGRAPERMQALAPEAKVLAGGLLNGRPSQAKLSEWAENAR